MFVLILKIILKNRHENFQSSKPLWIPLKGIVMDTSLKNKALEAIFFVFGHVTTVLLGMSFISEYFLSKALS